MNILSKLPFISEPKSDLTPEEIELEDKKARIQFHREKVRNGPAKFSSPTSGQIRRAKDRDIKSGMKKTRRRQVRAFLAAQAEAATIRGHLQAASVLAYGNPLHMATPTQARASVIWLTERFAEAEGEIVVTTELVVDALTAALNRYQTLTGQPTTPLSPAYVLPVRVAA